LEEWKSRFYENERKGALVEELQNRIRILGEEIRKYEQLLAEKNNDLAGQRKMLDLIEDLKLKNGGLEDELSRLKDSISRAEDENLRLNEKIRRMQEELDNLRPLKEARDASLRAGKDAESLMSNMHRAAADASREIERLRLENEDLSNKCRNLSELGGKCSAYATENSKL
jgi:chromosome segregation ATPase